MSKTKSLTFSGREEDFIWFSEQFEARMYTSKLSDTLLDKIKTPEFDAHENNTERTARETAEAALAEDRYKVWCELLQCLDRKSALSIRSCKPNGTAAWKALLQTHKSTERPRIQKTMTRLTSLRMDHGEKITDYLTRAEELQMDLTEVSEAVSDDMFVAMVLKGLPRDFDQIVTVLNFGEKKDYSAMKQDLVNFANSRKTTVSAFNSDGSKRNIKCHKCKQFGHTQNECTQKPKTTCYNCGKPGHFSRDCRLPSQKKCDICHKTNHITANCFSKNSANNSGGNRPQNNQQGNRNRANMAAAAEEEEDDHMFCFASSTDNEETTNNMDTCELLIDSGCTGYMIKDKHLFVDLNLEHHGTVGNANKSRSAIEGCGTAQFKVKDTHGTLKKMQLSEAFFVPSYSHNLISVDMLNRKGVSVMFPAQQEPQLVTSNGTAFPMAKHNNLFSLEVFTNGGHTAMKAETLTRWHERMGHNNKRDVALLESMVDGLTIKSGGDQGVCGPCATQKAKRTPIKRTWGTRAETKLDIVHADTLGPLHVNSIDGYRYAIGFIDSYSRYAVVYMMRTKDECLLKLQSYVADVGTPRTLVTDGAKEYTSGALEQFCRDRGIRHELSAPYVPEDNGKIERVWGTVVGMARCMVERAGAPQSFWSHALLTAFQLKNFCIHSSHGKTPYELFMGNKPNVSHLRVFGCVAYAYVERGRKKLDAKAKKGMFLGYQSNCNAYTVLVPTDNGSVRILQTRSVTFDEDNFYYRTLQTTDAHSDVVVTTLSESESDDEIDTPEVSGGNDMDSQDLVNEGGCQDLEDQPPPAMPTIETQPDDDVFDEPPQATLQNNDDFTPPPARERAPSTRIRRRPTWLGDYVSGEQFDDEAHLCMVAVEMNDNLPRNATEALKDPNWKRAMEDEFNSLTRNNVWNLELLPNGRTAIGGKWHFVIKRGANGEVIKYKARYVAKGYTQQYGRDYSETYSPTVKLSTIRCLLSCAAQLKCELYQMDIKTAYLNAPIDEEIYMHQPDGFSQQGSSGAKLVCKLVKSLYGLKQSGRNWYKTLLGYLELLGFISSYSDSCLFTRKNKHGIFEYVCVWVDDIIYFSQDSTFADRFKLDIAKKFTIGDQSQLTWFLGMKVNCTPGRVEISQHQYITTLLTRFGMEQCKPVSTPVAEKAKFKRDDCPPDGSPQQREMKNFDYRGLIGCLNYLATTTRPDLAYIAHTLSSYLENPGMVHWTAGKHVLRYLKGTIDYSLIYKHDTNGLLLNGYSDSDYAGHIDTSRSTAAYCFALQRGSGCIQWCSKLQKTVATSTAEAELNAATMAAQEAVHLQQLLDFMGYPQPTPTTILVDNQACIALTLNPTQHGKTKHFNVKLNYLRELVSNQTVVLFYISTDLNTADILTKGLGRLKTLKFTAELLGTEVCSESGGFKVKQLQGHSKQT